MMRRNDYVKGFSDLFATVNDIPDMEFKVEILEDGPIKKYP